MPAMAEQPVLGFGGLLRQLRALARLTQEELAEAAGVSPRSVSDLERGINRTARQGTAEVLAGGVGAGRAGPGGRARKSRRRFRGGRCGDGWAGPGGVGGGGTRAGASRRGAGGGARRGQ